MNGLYLSADCLSTLSSGADHAMHVACSQDIVHEWEKFNMTCYPDGKAVLQNVKTGWYLSVAAAPSKQWLVVVPQRPYRPFTERELFHLVELGGLDERQIELGVLRGYTTEELSARRREMKESGEWVALRSYNGRYVSCNEEGKGMPGATCNSRRHRRGEYFRVREA
jgi:hypothetical protein